MIRKKSIYLGVAGFVSVGLSACGGGAADNAPTPPTPPQVTQATLQAQLLAYNQVHLVIQPGTDSTVAAYCLRTDAVTPAASDACFGTQTTRDMATTGSATQGTSVRLWTKNQTGEVKKQQELALPGKTCGAQAHAAAMASKLPAACLITDQGELVLALDNVKAPVSVQNFLRYVNEGFYNGTSIHRVLSNYVVQGGGFVWDGTNYTKKTAIYGPIDLETPATTGLSNTQYSVAMARTSTPKSATTEFFINVVNNTGLDTASGGYAVFGQVIFGQTTTLSAVTQVPVRSSTILTGENSLPVTPLALQWAYQIKE